jgi:RNA 3'-terminal phosphate cyclase (ATP)
MDTVVIDGSEGEGGGQMLRTSLGLSLVTGRAFRVENIRARRGNPGLRRQHLAAVRAAGAVGVAEIEGDELGSKTVSFRPTTIRAGEHTFSVGTAGSATLVLQTVLPALLRADAPSSIVLEGGTDNPMAPSFDFLQKSFAPFVNRTGAKRDLAIERRGFYPAGGGRFTAQITPARTLTFPDLIARGDVRRVHLVARVAHLPSSIAHRMLLAARDPLELDREGLMTDFETGSVGPGVELEAHVTLDSHVEVHTVLGEKRLRSEQVAALCVAEVQSYLATGVPVGEHLADQLLLLAALAGKGTFVTSEPTLHTRTQCDIIARFLEVPIRIERDGARYAVIVG